jgi:hypothetical protein
MGATVKRGCMAGLYIYCIRDGRDVAISWYHFVRSNGTYDGSFDLFFRRVILEGLWPYGNWFEHVAQWIQHESPRLLVVRYEELRNDRYETVRRIARFCGAAPSSRELDAITSACSFESMKANESFFLPVFSSHFEGRTAGHYQPSVKTILRRGVVGEHAAVLSSLQQRDFAREFEARLKPFLPPISDSGKRGV